MSVGCFDFMGAGVEGKWKVPWSLNLITLGGGAIL